jgi:hypothetical protein
MKIGFTGTREGMSQQQKEEFVLKLFELQPTEFHHGDCEGADAEAHDIVREFFPNAKIHVHPPIYTNRQACKDGDVHYDPDHYIPRDQKIVEMTEYLIGAPIRDEEERRSGTWTTIRYARKLCRDNFILTR